MKGYEGVILLGISQLITFGVFSIKVFWNSNKELGKAHQRIDELTEDVNNIGGKLRDYKHLNDQNIGHIQDYLCDKTDYKPPTLTIRGAKWKQYP